MYFGIIIWIELPLIDLTYYDSLKDARPFCRRFSAIFLFVNFRLINIRNPIFVDTFKSKYLKNVKKYLFY